MLDVSPMARTPSSAYHGIKRLEVPLKNQMLILLSVISISSMASELNKLGKNQPLASCEAFKKSYEYTTAPKELRDAWDELSAASCDLEKLMREGKAFTQDERRQVRWAEMFKKVEGERTDCAKKLTDAKDRGRDFTVDICIMRKFLIAFT